jgi:uroporphyrinogen-III synthase
MTGEDDAMKRPLEGRSVALAEGRQLEELAALLAAEGAEPLRYPLLSMLDAPDAGPVNAWLDGLIAGRLDLLVLMTGEAVRRLAGLAERGGRKDAFVEALGKVATLTRGPKPGKALAELGLKPTRVAPAPTTDGVIAALRGDALAGRAVGYTLYAVENPALDGFLRSAGAAPHPVLSYVYAPASDDERVAELIGRLAGGAVDWLVITSTPQVERLFEVAEGRGLGALLQAGLARSKVAAVGPVAAEACVGRGVRVDVCPEQGWVMKNLVRQMARTTGGGA